MQTSLCSRRQIPKISREGKKSRETALVTLLDQADAVDAEIPDASLRIASEVAITYFNREVPEVGFFHEIKAGLSLVTAIG